MRRIWDLDQETFNLVAGAFLLAIIIFLLWCFGQYNESYITIVDENVRVVDKYHKAEDCTWYTDSNGSSYESCDPEKFVVIFDNKDSIDLKQQAAWSDVRENQLWHYHKEQGRLWTISKEVYPL